MNWFGRRRRGKSAKEASVSSFPRKGFFWLGGRRHFADAPYVLPNDLQEINRLDLQHFLFRYLMRGNYLAPIPSPLSILDIGTGTGRWAKEMAGIFPQGNIIGIDTVPPDATAETPPNCLFMPGNVLEGLSFANNSFDFVHQRMLFLALPLAQWPNAVREMKRITQPGGWIQLLEAGIVHNGGPAMTALMNWGTQVTALRGIDVGL